MNNEPAKHIQWLTLAIIVLGLAVLPSGCDDDTPTSGGSGPGPASFNYDNNLVFRIDNFEIDFTENYYCFCEDWEDQIKVHTLKVFAGFDPKDPVPDMSYWSLKIVMNDVSLGDSLQFPVTFNWDQPEDLALFIYQNPGEFSSQERESKGTIVIKRIDCGSSGGIEFYIDATIDSEFHGGGAVRVTGSFTAPVLEPPSR